MQKLEDFDFLLLLQDQLSRQQTVQVFSHTASLKVQVTSIPNQQKKFLLKIPEDNLLQQASALKILKLKKKKHHQLSQQNLKKQLKETTDQLKIQYLKFILAKFCNKKISQQQKYSVFKHEKSQKYLIDDSIKRVIEIFTPQQLLKMKYSLLVRDKNSKQNLLAKFLIQQKIKLVALPFKQQESKKWNNSEEACLSQQPYSYFKFLGRMNKILYIPAILGMATLFLNYIFGFTVIDSPFDPIYGMSVMIIGLFFFLQTQKQERWDWRIHQNGQDLNWAILQGQVQMDKKNFQQKISPVTGLPIYFQGLTNRIKLITKTCIKIVPLGIITLIFMVASLNIRGMVESSHKLIRIDFLSELANQGAIFDANSNYAFIPVLFHTIFLNYIDQKLWRPIARSTSKDQCYCNYKDYQKSIIIKFVVYQFLITFLDMFYIAFVRFDIEGLRQQFVMLFLMDSIRRVLTQTIIPYAIQRFSAIRPAHAYSLQHQVNSYLQKPQYQAFDDYLQIVTNFGYLAMLSSCFPQAPLFILLAHKFQEYHDKLKVNHVYRKSLPKVFVGIGFWKRILFFISITAVFTNIALFAFSSDQITQILPNIYQKSQQLVNSQFQDLLGNVSQYTQNTIANTFIQSMGQQKSGLIDFLENNNQTEQNIGQILTSGTQTIQPKAKVQVMALVWVLQHIALGIVLSAIIIYRRLPDPAVILDQRRVYKKRLKNKMVKKFLSFTKKQQQ